MIGFCFYFVSNSPLRTHGPVLVPILSKQEIKDKNKFNVVHEPKKVFLPFSEIFFLWFEGKISNQNLRLEYFTRSNFPNLVSLL